MEEDAKSQTNVEDGEDGVPPQKVGNSDNLKPPHLLDSLDQPRLCKVYRVYGTEDLFSILNNASIKRAFRRGDKIRCIGICSLFVTCVACGIEEIQLRAACDGQKSVSASFMRALDTSKIKDCVATCNRSLEIVLAGPDGSVHITRSWVSIDHVIAALEASCRSVVYRGWWPWSGPEYQLFNGIDYALMRNGELATFIAVCNALEFRYTLVPTSKPTECTAELCLEPAGLLLPGIPALHRTQ